MTPNIYDLNSPDGIREIVAALCMGYNYRLYTERETRTQLLDAYEQLLEILNRLPRDADYSEWMEALQEEVDGSSGNLTWWLLGLARKTAVNLGVKREDRLDYLREVGEHLRAATEGSDQASFESAMLLLWAGAATLTIRGSRKWVAQIHGRQETGTRVPKSRSDAIGP